MGFREFREFRELENLITGIALVSGGFSGPPDFEKWGLTPGKAAFQHGPASVSGFPEPLPGKKPLPSSWQWTREPWAGDSRNPGYFCT